MLLLLLLIQCKISLYLGPVRTVRCFVTPPISLSFQREFQGVKVPSMVPLLLRAKVRGDESSSHPQTHDSVTLISHNTTMFTINIFRLSATCGPVNNYILWSCVQDGPAHMADVGPMQ